MLDQVDRSKSGKRVLQIRHLFRNEFELIGGQVFGKHSPTPVQYQAAGRWNRFNAYPIALRFFRKKLVIADLQLHQPCDHNTEQENADDDRKDDPRRKQLLLGMQILDGCDETH